MKIIDKGKCSNKNGTTWGFGIRSADEDEKMDVMTYHVYGFGYYCYATSEVQWLKPYKHTQRSYLAGRPEKTYLLPKEFSISIRTSTEEEPGMVSCYYGAQYDGFYENVKAWGGSWMKMLPWAEWDHIHHVYLNSDMSIGEEVDYLNDQNTKYHRNFKVRNIDSGEEDILTIYATQREWERGIGLFKLINQNKTMIRNELNIEFKSNNMRVPQTSIEFGEYTIYEQVFIDWCMNENLEIITELK